MAVEQLFRALAKGAPSCKKQKRKDRVRKERTAVRLP